MERVRIIFITLLLCGLSLHAQQNNHEEAVYVSLNSTNLLVGDHLSFSAFVYSISTGNKSRLSSVLYLELIDEKGISAFQTKVGLIDGRGSGSVYINSSLFEGTYRLVAYTRWMKNFGTYFEQPILVFNPHNGVVKDKALTGDPLRIKEELPIIQAYGQLESASIALENIETSDLSVSIEKVNELYYDNSIQLKTHGAPLESFDILPEYKYALIQGVIKKESEGLENVRINMTLEGSSMQVSSTTSDQFGRFWMSYNPDLVTNKGLLVAEDTSNAEIKIVAENYQNYSEFDDSKFTIDSVIAQELVDRSVITQIKKAYKKSAPLNMKNDEVFIGTEALVYQLKDYTSFPSIRDVFIEYIPKVDVSKSEDNFKMEVRCKDLPGLFFKDFPALILLNGMISDAETILTLSPNNVEKVEVLPTYYFVDDQTFKGVVSVHTNAKGKEEFSGNGVALSFASFQTYSEKGYQVSLNDPKLPWMEPSVYWKPIHKHPGGNLILDFVTSRLNGVYEISIRGISKSGKPVNEVRYIRIKDSDL